MKIRMRIKKISKRSGSGMNKFSIWCDTGDYLF